MEATRVTGKNLRVMASAETMQSADSEQDVENVVSGIDWSAVEDAVNDQLPDGYYCKLDD